MKPDNPLAHYKTVITHKAVIFADYQIKFVQVKGGHYQAETVDLPDGLIVKGWIQDKQSVTAKLMELGKLSHQQLSGEVNLQVPEYQTFVKSVFLANLPSSNLPEAILWKVKDYLPLPVDQMHLDWALVKQDDKGHHFQVMGLPQKLLNQYIEICSQLDLRVVAVEPPSLTLMRLSREWQHPAIVIEAEPTVNLVATSEAGTVELTALGQLKQTGLLTSLVQDLLGYYQDKFNQQIDHCYVVGSQSSQVKPELQKLKLDITDPPESSKIKAEELTGYTLAEKPVAPPEDPHTINLVPQAYHQGYYQASSDKQKRELIKISLLALLILNLVTVYFLGQVFVMRQRQTVSQAEQNRNTSLSSIEQGTQAGRLEAQAKLVTQVADIRPYTGQVIRQLLSLTPDSIRLGSLSVTLDPREGVVSGIAPTQQDLLQFKQQLEQDAYFDDIGLPVNVYEIQQNIPFSIKFSWQIPETNSS